MRLRALISKTTLFDEIITSSRNKESVCIRTLYHGIVHDFKSFKNWRLTVYLNRKTLEAHAFFMSESITIRESKRK